MIRSTIPHEGMMRGADIEGFAGSRFIFFPESSSPLYSPWMWRTGCGPGFGWEEFRCPDVGLVELEALRMLVVRGVCDLKFSFCHVSASLRGARPPQ